MCELLGYNITIISDTFKVMIAPKENLSCRTYNVHAMSFTPKELFEVVKRRMPELEIVYKIDGRQKIGKTEDTVKV